VLIEIFFDLICPWCYIGSHRLKRALARRPRVQTHRRWVPFQLNAELPANGIDRSLYLAIKFGGGERARRIHSLIEETAAADGLPLQFSRIRTVPNTLSAHRVVALAQRQGAADALVEALFAAYFVRGDDLGDHDLLASLATGAGLEDETVRRVLAEPPPKDGRLTSDGSLRELDLHSVPFFLFDGRYGIGGAQEASVFLPLIDLGLVGLPVTASG